MADPRREDGHIDVPSEIAQALMGAVLGADEYRLLWVVWWKTWGGDNETALVSLEQFQALTGLKPAAVAAGLRRMERAGLLKRKGNIWSFQNDWERWRLPRVTRSPKELYMRLALDAAAEDHLEDAARWMTLAKKKR